MNKLSGMDWLVVILLIIGGLNWGLVGLLDLNVVSKIFGEGGTLTRIIYIIVGLAGLYAIWGSMKWGRK